MSHRLSSAEILFTLAQGGKKKLSMPFPLPRQKLVVGRFCRTSLEMQNGLLVNASQILPLFIAWRPGLWMICQYIKIIWKSHLLFSTFLEGYFSVQHIAELSEKHSRWSLIVSDHAEVHRQAGICWYAAVIRVAYVGLSGMPSDNGRRRGKYSIFNSPSSMKRHQLKMGPLAALHRAGRRGYSVVLSCWQDALYRFCVLLKMLLQHIWFTWH